MKKNDKITNQKKKGKNVKDFVTQAKNPIREMIPLKIPNDFTRSFKNEIEPIDLFPEWPTDEEIKVFKLKYKKNFIK
jgi:hypothetical protein